LLLLWSGDDDEGTDKAVAGSTAGGNDFMYSPVLGEGFSPRSSRKSETTSVSFPLKRYPTQEASVETRRTQFLADDANRTMTTDVGIEDDKKKETTKDRTNNKPSSGGSEDDKKKMTKDANNNNPSSDVSSNKKQSGRSVVKAFTSRFAKRAKSPS